jgi:four helix bundle protein
MARIKTHRDLEVYSKAFDAAMRIFEMSKAFPKEETYSLTDQVRRSSRSVCANLAEAWRLRRYEAAFVSKLTDCEREAAETQTWVEFAVHCKCVSRDQGAELYQTYHAILATLVGMKTHAESWVIPSGSHPRQPK